MPATPPAAAASRPVSRPPLCQQQQPADRSAARHSASSSSQPTGQPPATKVCEVDSSSTVPPCVPPLEPLPGPSSSVDVPRTSAGGQANGSGTRRTGPPPAKRRVLIPSPPPPEISSHTSAVQQSYSDARSSRQRASAAEKCPAPSPPAALERWFDKSEEDEQPRPLQFRPRRTPGVQLDFQTDYSASDIFQLFFSKEVIRTLCSNTNKYAARRSVQGIKRQWTDVNADEMLKFLSITIYMGLMKPSATRDLWRKDRLHSHPFPASVMAGYRYEAISAYLHMSDPDADVKNDQLRGQPEYDGLFRLKPLQEQILAACRAYYQPHQNLSIDERMVATKARIRMKQYMKDKPTKWGYKLFILADSCSGYTCDFSVYEGKARKPTGNGLSFDAVVSLLHVPSLGTGYTVYVDNFYTSSMLFRHLHRIGFGACGTIRETRIGFPKTTANALPKKADRGEMRWIRDGPLLFVKWRVTRDVTMCSTVHKAYSGQSVQRRVRSKNGTWSTQQISVPEPVKAYNKFMGGVDLSDALIKYYSVTQKTRRWYVKLFLHFVDIAVVNSFIIHKEMALARQQKSLSQKSFREVLCMELADVGQPQVSIPAEVPSEPSMPPSPECGPQGCFPVPVPDMSTENRLKATQGRRKCVHCKMKTMFMCRSCSVPLCIIVDRMCFTEWHDQKSS
ncbi:piggyBac transposable element-derived protein 4-like [Astyanax mexicanus]|uniref:piggyBac transposable element-derived protein 4-like n=1 Tax=Astyanax mexicanus TaxID=7994 RepID=UPI0020CB0D94|nr:piggyBac transposable element-derived protein 4-like [Astyanax mexicanus]